MVKIPYEGVVAVVHRETTAAVLLSFEYDSTKYEEVWVPKSNLHDDSIDVIDEAIAGEEEEVYIAKWWLDQQ
jgi:hypothetical protein